MATETERKYLIEYPDLEKISGKASRIIKMTQTYLLGSEGEDRRVRRSEENGIVTYTHTVKVRISFLSRSEDERVIDEAEYKDLLASVDPEFAPIEKTRYCIPTVDGHIAEVDVYEGITDYAVCEIELSDESEKAVLPDCLMLIREVTGESEYTNRHIARMNRLKL